MKKITKNNIPTQWNFDLLVKGDVQKEFEKQRKIIEKEGYRFINKWKDRDDYVKSPKALKEALDEYEHWMRNYAGGGVEGYYYWLKSNQDQNDPELKARVNKITDFAKKIENDMQFFALRIARIPSDRQGKFLEYSGLKNFRHFLEKSFDEAQYLLSESEEKIMNLKAQPAHANWVKMTKEFLSKEEREIITEKGGKKNGQYKKEKKNLSQVIGLIDSTDKKVRDEAARALNDIFHKNLDVAEAELNAILHNKKVDDELRKVDRPDTIRHISDDVETESIDVLVEAVAKRFDISKRYYQFKAKLLKVKRLEYHERNVPYGKLEGDYSFDQAVELVGDTLQKLDTQFYDIFRNFLEKGHVDVYPNKGKTDGAFCVYTLVSAPVYILLNHTGKLRDVLTLAHEVGHGINDELMRRQNALNFETSLATAEVASTFFEDFVLQSLEAGVDDETRLALMLQKLNSDISTIFRQIACYRFEQELHMEFRKRGYLSKEEIGKLFQRHMASYMGSAVEQSQGSQNWWIYWGHIRRFFYNYSYANGLLISKSLQASVKKDPSFVGKIKDDFLSAGASESPKDIFKKMGIDITKEAFWNQGLDEVDNLLKEATKLAKKLGKI